MESITITTENFDAEVLHSEKPVLLDFWASWCGPCRMLSPIVDEVAEERSDVKVGKVNVDEQPDLAAQFGVMSIPTLLVFQNGRLVNQAVGARPKSGVLALLDRGAAPQSAKMPRCAHPAPGGAFLRFGERCVCGTHHLICRYDETISRFCTNAQKNGKIKEKSLILSCFTTLSR